MSDVDRSIQKDSEEQQGLLTPEQYEELGRQLDQKIEQLRRETEQA